MLSSFMFFSMWVKNMYLYFFYLIDARMILFAVMQANNTLHFEVYLFSISTFHHSVVSS